MVSATRSPPPEQAGRVVAEEVDVVVAVGVVQHGARRRRRRGRRTARRGAPSGCCRRAGRRPARSASSAADGVGVDVAAAGGGQGVVEGRRVSAVDAHDRGPEVDGGVDAAVGGDDLAGDRPGGVGGEEHDGVGDLLGGRTRRVGMTPSTASATPGLARLLAPHLGLDDAGGDAVGADAARAVLHGQGPGHAVEGGLAGRVHGPAGGAAQAADRADGDDRARPGGEHGREHGGRGEQRRADVDVPHLVELVDGQRLAVLAQPEPALLTSTSMRPPKASSAVGHGGGRAVGRAEVGGDDDRIVGGSAAVVASWSARAGDEGDAGAGGVEGAGDGRADAAAGAGDDRGATVASTSSSVGLGDGDRVDDDVLAGAVAAVGRRPSASARARRGPSRSGRTGCTAAADRRRSGRRRGRTGCRWCSGRRWPWRRSRSGTGRPWAARRRTCSRGRRGRCRWGRRPGT